jgi:hypothetical protein
MLQGARFVLAFLAASGAGMAVRAGQGIGYGEAGAASAQCLLTGLSVLAALFALIPNDKE